MKTILMSVLQSWRKEVEGVSEAQEESRCDRLAQLEGLAVFPNETQLSQPRHKSVVALGSQHHLQVHGGSP